MKTFVFLKSCAWFLFLNLLGCTSASGVRFRKPKVNGNITVIMIPQDNSGCNDSNILVAVKSDCKVLSEDLNLLNLVVQDSAANRTDKGCTIRGGEVKTTKSTTRAPEVTPGALQIEHGLMNRQNTAKYFVAAKKLTPNNGTGSDPGTPEVNSNAANIFKLLGFEEPSKGGEENNIKNDEPGDVLKFLETLNTTHSNNVASNVNQDANVNVSSSNKDANAGKSNIVDFFKTPDNNHTSSENRTKVDSTSNKDDDAAILNILKMLNVPSNNNSTSNVNENRIGDDFRGNYYKERR